MDFTAEFEKQEDEQLPIGVDYVGRLPSGKTVASASMSAVLYPDGTDMAGVILSGVPTVTTTRITQMVIAGTNGKDYKVTFKANLSGGGVLEDDLLIKVRNR